MLDKLLELLSRRHGEQPEEAPEPASKPKAATAKKGGGRKQIARATDDQIRRLEAYSGKILTRPGGEIQTNDRQRKLLAILEDGTCLLGVNEPLNPLILEVLRAAREKDIKIKRQVLIPSSTLQNIYFAADAAQQKLLEYSGQEQAAMLGEFAEIIEDAASMKTSDVHFIVKRYEALIRIRRHGVMKDYRKLSADKARTLLAAAFNASEESDTSYNPYDGQGARLSGAKLGVSDRVQSLRLQYNPLSNQGRQLVVRILYDEKTEEGKDVDDLGYSAHQIRDLRIMRKRPSGFNIISGGTGSGKSTTLQVGLTALMREARFELSLQTIEDPPEYVIEGAAQIPILNAKTQEERREKFSKAISDVLRSDPDVIMIGEIRDDASAGLAFEGAMTGHAVWASLHANDAMSILDRLRDKKVELYKLADHTLVTGLIGQRLMRTLCPHCKMALTDVLSYEDDRIIDDLLQESLEKQIGAEHFDRIFFTNENGCDHCTGGTVGRTVAAETIVPDQDFMSFIRKEDKLGAFNYWIEHLDGMTMLEHATQKMLMGEVDPREVEGKVSPLRGIRKDRLKKILVSVDEEMAAKKKKADARKEKQS
jgi:general secretion pathway protein E